MMANAISSEKIFKKLGGSRKFILNLNKKQRFYLNKVTKYFSQLIYKYLSNESTLVEKNLEKRVI